MLLLNLTNFRLGKKLWKNACFKENWKQNKLVQRVTELYNESAKYLFLFFKCSLPHIIYAWFFVKSGFVRKFWRKISNHPTGQIHFFKCDELALHFWGSKILLPSFFLPLRLNYPKILTKTSIPCKNLLRNSYQRIPLQKILPKKSSQKNPTKKYLQKIPPKKIPPQKILQKNST